MDDAVAIALVKRAKRVRGLVVKAAFAEPRPHCIGGERCVFTVEPIG